VRHDRVIRIQSALRQQLSFPEAAGEGAAAAVPILFPFRHSRKRHSYLITGSAETSSSSSLNLRVSLKPLRRASDKPVQTSKTPPSDASAATIWPSSPPASPVWMKRFHARGVADSCESRRPVDRSSVICMRLPGCPPLPRSTVSTIDPDRVVEAAS
jgi:hypothetical protein